MEKFSFDNNIDKYIVSERFRDDSRRMMALCDSQIYFLYGPSLFSWVINMKFMKLI